MSELNNEGWDKPHPPPAPFMRIGDHGETVNPKTGERIPPPTTEWRRSSVRAFKIDAIIIVTIFSMSFGILIGWQMHGGICS